MIAMHMYRDEDLVQLQDLYLGALRPTLHLRVRERMIMRAECPSVKVVRMVTCVYVCV
jgi:hypothetical protein